VISTCKIKYRSTSSRNKIYSGMNATNIIIYINNSVKFYFPVKIRVLHRPGSWLGGRGLPKEATPTDQARAGGQPSMLV
jgi:hypothetical protein